MKKLIFFLLIAVSAQALVDERLNDVYFANGINTKRYQAKANAEKILEPEIRKSLYGDIEDKMYQKIGKVDYAYNETHDMFADEDGWFDLIESFFQKINYQEY